MTKKIAIIGSGISGLTCAYLLSRQYEVHVFEANDYLGGHTATKTVTVKNKQYDIDTGFIVFNDWTYPNFIKLLEKIGIKKQKTQMSFSVFDQISGFEYNGHTLTSLFSQKSNILSPRFYSFLFEIFKFNKVCKKYQTKDFDDDLTLQYIIKNYNFSDFFAQHYILPMVAAIWSGSLDEAKDFPLKFFLKFFMNHGLLNVINRPQWYVVQNGSKSYISSLIKDVHKLYLSTPIASIKRHSDHVIIKTMQDLYEFDDVIIATHSDQALNLLEDASPNEHQVLNDIPYRNNDVTLHTDISQLPKYRASWASWNFRNPETKNVAPKVTYNMNILQTLDTETTFCVSLNQKNDIHKDKILAEYQYSHPVINNKTIKAQQKRDLICGVNRTHFCGAYWYQGFHEDGVNSALDVCKRFGVTL